VGDLLPRLARSVDEFLSERDAIHPLRQANLRSVAVYINGDLVACGAARVLFLCTHNSRRSQIAQAWGLAAAARFDVPIVCFSGGSAPTHVHPSSMAALASLGFEVRALANGRFMVGHSATGRVELWSKRYQDASSGQDFIAIANCSQADEGCPSIPSARRRLAMLFDDPRVADGRPDEAEVYATCARTIGRELVSLFALVHAMRNDRP
jgi:arsenate reductase (thioredoxin)